jgi:hypothetical protein
MYFKPRIFISSTLADNLSIREELDEFFESVGAELMLYESNLTPSISPMVYRRDIKEADFVIFIIKDTYGKKTNKGISGTHDEFRIAEANNIPKHVYIKRTAKTSKNKILIKEIENQEISYYYFQDDKQLLDRIKQTVFTIARDIVISKIAQAEIDFLSIRKIDIYFNYNQALAIFKIMDELLNLITQSPFDHINSNIVLAALDNLSEWVQRKGQIFIDTKINDLFLDYMKAYDIYGSAYSLDYVSGRTYRDIPFPVYDIIRVSFSSVVPSPQYSIDDYKNMFDELMNKFTIFKAAVLDEKNQIDIKTYSK